MTAMKFWFSIEVRGNYNVKIIWPKALKSLKIQEEKVSGLGYSFWSGHMHFNTMPTTYWAYWVVG